MIFSTLKTNLKSLPCGKKLNHSLYITEESLEIADKKLYAFTADLKKRVNAGSNQLFYTAFSTTPSFEQPVKTILTIT